MKGGRTALDNSVLKTIRGGGSVCMVWLSLGSTTATELTRPFAISQPAISTNLKVLEQAGLILRGRDAQRRPYRIEARPLAEATG